MRRAIVIGVGLTALLLGGCKQEKPTGVMLTIHWEAPIAGLDQVKVVVYPEGNFTDIRQDDIPDPATDPVTQSPTSILLLFPKGWAGRTVHIGLEAWLGGTQVGAARLEVDTVKGRILERSVDLNDVVSECGNGVIEGVEQCDGTDFAGQDCHSAAGLQHGTLACTGNCRVDVSGCTQCGNGALEGAEICDGDELVGQTCVGLGFRGGELKCLADCSGYDTANCAGGCGNGVADPGEECDGADVGDQTCLTAAGLADGTLACTALCHLDVSGCFECGNGAVEAGEACDGAAFGGRTCASEGFASGILVCAPDCTTIDTSNCCGDGVKGFYEQCDGTDFGGQTCLTMTGISSGSLRCTQQCFVDVSGCHSCGNSIIEPGEVCEGSNLNGETCLSRGYLLGGIGLRCSSTCEAYDVSGCGDPIDNETNIQTGLDQAASLTGHQLVSIQPGSGTHNITSTLTVNDTQGQADGVTLQPLDGQQVCLEAQGVFPVFSVLTGNNVFRDLCVTEADAAYVLNATNNVVIRNAILNNSRTPGVLLLVQSTGNRIESNRFDNTTAALGSRAIRVLAENNDVVMNVIRGSYEYAMGFSGFTSATDVTNIDHNSVHITGGLGGGGVRLANVDFLCYRNNIIWGDTTSTGIETLVGEAAFGPQTHCAMGIRFDHNVNENHQTQCLGAATDCDQTCYSPFPNSGMCTLADDPGFSGPDLCLDTASGLVDAGVDVWWDMVDGSPDRYIGIAPDVGARETGSVRSFGTVASFCGP